MSAEFARKERRDNVVIVWFPIGRYLPAFFKTSVLYHANKVSEFYTILEGPNHYAVRFNNIEDAVLYMLQDIPC